MLCVVLMGCTQWQQLEGPQTGDQVHGFTSAIRSLDGRLTAQLNAAACLIHLLIGEQGNWPVGTQKAEMPQLKAALREGSFDVVYECIQHAVQAQLPTGSLHGIQA